MGNLLEDLLAELNKNIFYREFSFSKNKFTPAPGQEMEFADHVVWIDDLLMIYQLKQREAGSNESEESERKWFQGTVIKKGTRQVRATLGYLKNHAKITIENQRGHVFNVNSAAIKHIVKLVIYQPDNALPLDCAGIKHHFSRTGGGFIHVLPWDDYLGVCRTLITPAEVAEYLDFREGVIQRGGQETLPSEAALVGQFLSGDDQARPDEQYVEHLKRLKRSSADFDIFFLMDGVADRIEHWEGPGSVLNYYKIIAEFAKLNRSELKEVKKRVLLCLEAADEGRFMATRIIAMTGCGFAFFAALGAPNTITIPDRMGILKYLSSLAKYDKHLHRQVGVSFSKDGSDRLIDWCLIESDWQYDDAVEEWLRDNNPFPPLRFEVRERYESEGEER